MQFKLEKVDLDSNVLDMVFDTHYFHLSLIIKICVHIHVPSFSKYWAHLLWSHYKFEHSIYHRVMFQEMQTE